MPYETLLSSLPLESVVGTAPRCRLIQRADTRHFWFINLRFANTYLRRLLSDVGIRAKARNILSCKDNWATGVTVGRSPIVAAVQQL